MKAKRIPECGHPDSKHQAFGLCAVCYRKKYKENHPERYQKSLDRAKLWRQNNPKRVKENHIRFWYNLSYEEFEQLKEKQDNLCLICHTELTNKVCIDHDHSCCTGDKSCGKCIRGILCPPCNLGLGAFRDRPEVLLTAAEYLLGWRKQSEQETLDS